MKASSKNTFLKVSIVVLVVLNLLILAVLWNSTKPKHQKADSPHTRLIEQVGFDKKQGETFKDLVNQHRKSRKGIKDKLIKARQAYFRLLGTGTDDEKKARLQELALLESEEHRLLMQHFEDVMAICKGPQQKEKLKKLVVRTASRMEAPPKGERPPHPERMRPPR
jgi:hypothetical protein